MIRNRGVVATGRVESGALRVDEAKTGDNIGVLFKGIEKGQFDRGSVLTAAGEFPPIEEMGFVV